MNFLQKKLLRFSILRENNEDINLYVYTMSFCWTQEFLHSISCMTNCPVAHKCLLWQRQPVKDDWKSKGFFLLSSHRGKWVIYYQPYKEIWKMPYLEVSYTWFCLDRLQVMFRVYIKMKKTLHFRNFKGKILSHFYLHDKNN
jgi:hypothetical protein